MGLAWGRGLERTQGEIALLFISSGISNACPSCGFACPILTRSFDKPDNVIKSIETRVEESTFEPFPNAEEILFKAVCFNKPT